MYTPDKMVEVKIVQEDGSLGESTQAPESEAFPMISQLTAVFANPVTEDFQDYVDWNKNQ